MFVQHTFSRFTLTSLHSASTRRRCSMPPEAPAYRRRPARPRAAAWMRVTRASVTRLVLMMSLNLTGS
jgi:hypothetical protein